MSRKITRSERKAGKVRREPPAPKAPEERKARHLPWTAEQIAVMQEESRQSRERLRAICVEQGHTWRWIRRSRRHHEELCTRCGDPRPKEAHRAAPAGQRRRSGQAGYLFAAAMAMSGGIGGLGPMRGPGR